MWFSQREPDRLQRVDTGAGDWRQAIETVCGPGEVSLPDGLCGDADGQIWFANAGTASIGRLDPAAADPAATLELFTAPGLQTPFGLQAVGDFMAFTNNGGRVGPDQGLELRRRLSRARPVARAGRCNGPTLRG